MIYVRMDCSMLEALGPLLDNYGLSFEPEGTITQIDEDGDTYDAIVWSLVNENEELATEVALDDSGAEDQD